MKLYVGNLPYTMDEGVIMDRGTGRSKGFGFVEFENDTEAKAAISALNGRDFNGRALTVSEARPRAEGGGGGGRGGYGGGRGGGGRY
jgi:cold-inducible RNA-binding protein